MDLQVCSLFLDTTSCEIQVLDLNAFLLLDLNFVQFKAGERHISSLGRGGHQFSKNATCVANVCNEGKSAEVQHC